MNKRWTYNFFAICILLVALAATLLIGCAKIQQEDAPVTTTGSQSESLSEGETTELPTGNTQTEQTLLTETEPSLKIEPESDTNKEDIVFVTDPVDDKPTQDTKPTNPKPTQGQDTQVDDPPSGGGNGKPDKLLTYEEFLALSNEEQQAYFFLFENPLDYAAWLQQAQKDYQDNQDSIVITGPIDLSTLPT